jgi:hypothetical protein
VRLDEHARCDAIRLRELIAKVEVATAEDKAVTRHAINLANTNAYGLALPVFSTALEHAGDGPFSAFGRQQGRSCRTHPSGYDRPISRNGSQARQVTNIQPAHASWLSHSVIKKGDRQ